MSQDADNYRAMFSTWKSHTVQGCTYIEHHGNGLPPTATDMDRQPSPGDIYLDIGNPRGVWVYSKDTWVQWRSMAASKDIPHPNERRILYPNVSRFAWVPSQGFDRYKRQVDLMLDGNPDTAHVHVTNILQTEGELDSNSESQTESSSEEEEMSSRVKGSKRRLEKDESDEEMSSKVKGSKRASEKDKSDEESSELSSTGGEIREGIFSEDEIAETMDIDSPTSSPGRKHKHGSNCLTSMRESNGEIENAVGAAPADRRLVAGLEGKEFPPNTETIEWPSHNVLTFMPFTKVEDERDRDGEWVKYMAQAANATNVPNEGQFAVVLELPQALRRSDTRLDPAVNIAAIREQFSQTIRHHIAHGRAVKVREWYPERRCGFSIEEIASIRPAVDHDVHWQDAKERARNFERPKEENVDVVKHCNLYDFVLKAHDTDVCGNVLDLKNLRPEAPYWVTELADDVTSLYITRSDHYGNPKSRKPTAQLDTSHLGPQVVLYDAWRAQGWDIATHGGFVTYPHHDASGFCSYVYPRCGAKLWGFIRVKKECAKTDMIDHFLKYDDILDESWEKMRESCVMATILLEEGDVLIQPPGAWHTVYTPTKGMTSGGHFVLYDSLHLTEHIRKFDSTKDSDGVKRGTYSTNETHAIDRQLIRMMLALPDLVRNRVFRRRPLLAHMRMVYAASRGAGVTEGLPHFKDTDFIVKETQNERLAAMKIIDVIMKEMGLGWFKVNEELERAKNADWFDPGEAVQLDFLRDHIKHAV